MKWWHWCQQMDTEKNQFWLFQQIQIIQITHWHTYCPEAIGFRFDRNQSEIPFPWYWMNQSELNVQYGHKRYDRGAQIWKIQSKKLLSFLIFYNSHNNRQIQFATRLICPCLFVIHKPFQFIKMTIQSTRILYTVIMRQKKKRRNFQPFSFSHRATNVFYQFICNSWVSLKTWMSLLATSSRNIQPTQCAFEDLFCLNWTD